MYSQLTANIPNKWKDLFREYDQEIQDVSDLLDQLNKENILWFPEVKNVFKAFQLTNPEDLKVVIIGQDPYPTLLSNGKPRAQGLAFSVPKEDSASSLRTIYKELSRENTLIKKELNDLLQDPKDDLDYKNMLAYIEYTQNYYLPGKHGDLTSWAKQGVLLLNKSLTVIQNKPNSHAGVWDFMLKGTIKYINKHLHGVIFLLWGMEAQKLERLIDKKHFILKAGHPSSMNTRNTFIGCNHFRKINDHLVTIGQIPINWTIG